ncbi:G2/mitotic-specific cyclin S13-7-like protein [Tanacetum coccineum]
MTSALDHRQPIIAQGERRKPRALGDITNLVTTRTAVKKPTKKASKSLSSVLSARSKVASGIDTTKPKDPVIININEFDTNNKLAEVEYVEDIYMYYKLSMTEGCLRDYMDSQPDINARMRAILIDWLIQVHSTYGLMPETLYLTINIVDRYPSPLAVNDMITISDSTYSREQIRAMEKAILSRLGWYLTVPTPYVFTVRYAKASLPTNNEMENMVFFFTELGLMDYLVTIRNNPSMLVALAVYAARCTLNKTLAWTETLKHYTGYTEDQLGDCAKSLVGFHASASNNKFNAVYTKYVNPDRGAVARFPPATSLLVVNRHK